MVNSPQHLHWHHAVVSFGAAVARARSRFVEALQRLQLQWPLTGVRGADICPRVLCARLGLSPTMDASIFARPARGEASVSVAALLYHQRYHHPHTYSFSTPCLTSCALESLCIASSTSTARTGFVACSALGGLKWLPAVPTPSESELLKRLLLDVPMRAAISVCSV